MRARWRGEVLWTTQPAKVTREAVMEGGRLWWEAMMMQVRMPNGFKISEMMLVAALGNEKQKGDTKGKNHKRTTLIGIPM